MRASLLPLASVLFAVPALAQRTRAVVVVPGQVTRVITDTMGTPYEVPAPAGRAFAALAAVYTDLKLTPELRDSAMLQVGNPSFYRRETVAGRQISTYLSCGDGMTGPYADYYRIYLSLLSTVTPLGSDSATVRTVLLGSAVNVTEGARQPMPCESTGRLEVRIHQEVLKKLSGKR
jgi:hypothetical protein